MTIVGSARHGYFPDGRIPRFQRVEGNQARLLADFRYFAPDGDVIVAKAGMLYDGGSIPKLLQGFSTNPWADDVIGPATIHDWLCQLGRDQHASPYPSEQVHYLFYHGLKAIGVPEWRARARWAAVRTRGPRFDADTVTEAERLAAHTAITARAA